MLPAIRAKQALLTLVNTRRHTQLLGRLDCRGGCGRLKEVLASGAYQRSNPSAWRSQGASQLVEGGATAASTNLLAKLQQLQ